MSTRDAPAIDKLYTIGEGGRRNFLHPADVKGPHTTRRRVIGILLIAWLFALPFIEIGGYPAIFLDVGTRRFHVFGVTFGPTDSILLFFLLTAVGFALVVASALWGRVWCGYACPQTVFLEQLYRWVERLIEGSRDQQIRLDKAPWSAAKVLRKAAKHGAFMLLSFILSHLFLAYFVAPKPLAALMRAGPMVEPAIFIWAMAVTAFMYFNFAWFREQMCIIICPYGRLQSALSDRDTVGIAYDTRRGEPRGRGEKDGDCVDCFRCVAVCPTGIDIRQGMQLECVGCAACIDACDDVMAKVRRPPRLIRYDSQRGVEEGRRRFWRPRVGVYAALALVGLAALSLTAFSRRPLGVALVRQPGLPYVIDGDLVRNAFVIAAHNQSDEAKTLTLIVHLPPSARVLGALDTVMIAPREDLRQPVFLEAPRSVGPFDFSITIRDAAGKETVLAGRFTAPVAK
ncbi:MAG: cytochrome c oxidase accessory protein CcoG [Deltaproteobacteria bacterium]|nr:cytochrome c oxidase accessory protein CcoG [Deltaproteobacteria bacterium]